VRASVALRAGWQLSPEVEDLLRRREPLFECNPVNVSDVIAKPAVEGLVGGGDHLEGGLEIIGFHEDNGHVPGGSRLDPDAFSSDPGAAPRVLVGLLALTPRARRHRSSICFRLSPEQGCHERQSRHGSLPDDFDYDAQPGVDRSLITELATCRYLDTATNVLMIGPPGVGKAHLAVTSISTPGELR
jgi:hypothetical protein